MSELAQMVEQLLKTRKRFSIYFRTVKLEKGKTTEGEVPNIKYTDEDAAIVHTFDADGTRLKTISYSATLADHP